MRIEARGRAGDDPDMRAQLLHLAGPLRGRTVTYEGAHVLIGTDPDAQVRYPVGLAVQPRHAEIAFVEEGCAFYLRGIDGQVLVNRQEVKEVILQHCDLLELGVGGPKARFRVHAEKGDVCKPVRTMLGDALEVGGEGGVFAFTGSITRDLLSHASWQVKVGVPLLLAAVLVPVAFLAGWIGGGQPARSMEVEQRARAEQYERALAEMRDELERFRVAQATTVSREEVEQLRAQFEVRDRMVDQLIAENAAVKRIHETLSRGVCLLYGSYAFSRIEGGQTVYLDDYDGQRMEIEYTGSGFLASPDGHVITNDHIVRPWVHDGQAAQMEALGYEPVFLRFLAVFPGRAPVEVDPGSFMVRSDDVDVAVLVVTSVEGVPVLPLFEGDVADLRGEGVVLLGYPTGVNALLAKADVDVSRSLTGPGSTLISIVEGLAEHQAISPVITQGFLGEVINQQLVYDAETTSGGSGGPLFTTNGTVIGVNYGILPEFTGTNFGVPIGFARELLQN